MVTVKRPSRLFSFSDFSKTQPKQQQPGDRLDAQFIELIDAIKTTQDALAEASTIRLPANNDEVIARAVNDIIAKTQIASANVTSIAANALESERSAQMFAQDAERCISVMTQLISEWNAIREMTMRSADYAQRAAAAVGTEANSARSAANEAQAELDNAIAAKDEALQWAEYLAGPVVDAAQAPAYIADSPFPHGLYYQPVQGYGGVGGLWSAKWWAIYAANLVGNAGYYYLGAWDQPPLPGGSNPDTGQPVPNPLANGSIYYDNTAGTIFVWNGTAWTRPVAYAPGSQSSFVYDATANQQLFHGADKDGAVPPEGTFGYDVHVNGVRLLAGDDYSINPTGPQLSINEPLPLGSIVQWDFLLPPSALQPGAVTSFKINALTPDGSAVAFHLTYRDPTSGLSVDANVGDGAQLQVSLDGVVQEPGVDYTASGATLTMAQPPLATAKLWAVWFKPGAGSATTNVNPAMYTLKYNAKTITQAVADPGNTFIAWNTVAQTDASKLSIAARTDTNLDASNFWKNPAVVGKFIAIQRTTDANEIQHFVITAVVDHSTWFELSVTPVAASGAPFSGNNPIIVGVY